MSAGAHRGTTILVSGTAGTGKTSTAAHFVDAACRRGERCLYFSFEDSQGQLIRNMRSIGLNLDQWTRKNLLQFYVLKSRGTAHSNQLREFLLTEKGVDLLDVYVGPEGVLTGSSRLSQEAR